MAATAEMGCRMRLGFLLMACTLTVHATTYCVTVAGLGGEPDYEQRFSTWARDIDKTMKAAGADMKVDTLYGSDATRAKVQAVLDRVAKAGRPADALGLL